MTWQRRGLLYLALSLLLSSIFFAIHFVGSGFTGPEEVCHVQDWYGKSHLTQWEACTFRWGRFAALIAIYWAIFGVIVGVIGELIALLARADDNVP